FGTYAGGCGGGWTSAAPQQRLGDPLAVGRQGFGRPASGGAGCTGSNGGANAGGPGPLPGHDRVGVLEPVSRKHADDGTPGGASAPAAGTVRPVPGTAGFTGSQQGLQLPGRGQLQNPRHRGRRGGLAEHPRGPGNEALGRQDLVVGNRQEPAARLADGA